MEEEEGTLFDRGRSRRLFYEKEFQFSRYPTTVHRWKEISRGLSPLQTLCSRSWYAIVVEENIIRKNIRKNYFPFIGLIVWAGSLLNRDYAYAYRENSLDSDASRFINIGRFGLWLWRVARVRTDVSFQINQSDRPVLSTGERQACISLRLGWLSSVENVGNAVPRNFQSSLTPLAVASEMTGIAFNHRD